MPRLEGVKRGREERHRVKLGGARRDGGVKRGREGRQRGREGRQRGKERRDRGVKRGRENLSTLGRALCQILAII